MPAPSEFIHTVTWVPTSTTRPVGIWKKSVASLADFVRRMKSLSCQRGIPDLAAGGSVRLDRKQTDQDGDRQRQHGLLEGGRNDRQTFDRRQN